MPPNPLRFVRRRLFLALVLSAGAVASGCGDDSRTQHRPQTHAGDGASFEHVHGLGINPKDQALMIATHFGLFRVPADGHEAGPVGTSRQDIMGFTVPGPNRFLASGHPDLDQVAAGASPLLGLIESTNGGESWESVSLDGDADFHVLRASGAQIYGFDSTGRRLLVSDDGGEHWSRRDSPPLFDLAINPTNSRSILASSESGLLRSEDGGNSLKAVANDVGLIAWPTPERLFVVEPSGTVKRGPASGRNLKTVGQVGGHVVALTSAHETLYVALEEGTIKHSTDHGKSWSALLTAPPPLAGRK